MGRTESYPDGLAKKIHDSFADIRPPGNLKDKSVFGGARNCFLAFRIFYV